MDELKSCPFCGGDVRFDRAYSYFQDSVIYCEGCDMVFTLDDCTASDDDIVRAWNRRSEKRRWSSMKKMDQKIIKDLHAKISKSIEDSMGDTCPYCGGKGGIMAYQLLAVPGGNPPMKSKVFIPCYQCNGTGLYKKG